jgi:hypothetical protein
MELGLGVRRFEKALGSLRSLGNAGVLRYAQNDNVKQTTTTATTKTTATANAGPSTAPLAIRLREASLRMTFIGDAEDDTLLVMESSLN